MGTIITYGPPPDLNITASCIPYDQFIAAISTMVFFDDAIKLGCVCFIAGLLTMHVFQWIERKWK